MVEFPFNVYLGAFGCAFAGSLLLMPVWRVVCRRTGMVDEPGNRKIHLDTVPLAGGLCVFSSMALSLLAAVPLLLAGGGGAGTTHPLSHGLERKGFQLVAIMAGALSMLVLGALDDRHELKPAAKFAGQVIVALLVAINGVRITLFVPSFLFSVVVTVLWIVTLANALNFMDNMNGLCAGLGAIGSVLFGWKAAAAGQYLVALLAFLACGGLLGFLPYNFPRATAFLGDSGSHLVGYLLAVLAILPHFHTSENPSRLAVLNPILILFVPLADLIWVVLLRWRAGQPFYVGDNRHLSHRLVQRGLSRTSAVLVIWLLATVVGALSFI